MQGKVEICGVNTARLKVLSQKDMDRLLLRAKDGDDDARQQLIEGNLRLQPTSADDFNERRSDKTRGWRCVARYHHLDAWTSLIKHLGLPKFSDVKPERESSKVTVVVHNDYDFRD